MTGATAQRRLRLPGATTPSFVGRNITVVPVEFSERHEALLLTEKAGVTVTHRRPPELRR